MPRRRLFRIPSPSPTPILTSNLASTPTASDPVPNDPDRNAEPSTWRRSERYKQSARTSGGAEKWLDVRLFRNPTDAVHVSQARRLPGTLPLSLNLTTTLTVTMTATLIRPQLWL